LALLIFSQRSTDLMGQPIPLDQRYVDSILPRLKDMPDDSVKVRHLVKVSAMYFIKKADTALRLCLQADSLAESIQDYDGEIQALRSAGWSLATMGEQTRAFYYTNKAIALAEEHDPKQLVSLYGINFYIFGFNDDMEKAIVWARKSISSPYFKEAPYQLRWAIYFQIGKYHIQAGHLDSAQYYADLILPFIEKSGGRGDGAPYGESYMLLGDIDMKKARYSDALKHYAQADCPGCVAKAFQMSGNADSAIFYGKKELERGEQLNSPSLIAGAAQTLALAYSDVDPKQAVKYFTMTLEYAEKLFGAEKRKQMEKLALSEQQAKFEIQEKETANRNRIFQVIFVSVLAFFSVFSYLLWRNNRFKQQANRKLEDSYAELKATQAQLIQSEKMASLGELTAGIAHEIQNPLNFVNNFAEINKELVDEVKSQNEKVKSQNGVFPIGPDLLDDLEQNMEKINHHGRRADAIVKSMLQHSRTSSSQKEPTDLAALADEYLKLAYHGLRAKDKDFNVNLETDFDADLPKVNVVPQDIGRVLLNLYNNAFHAVQERVKKGEVGYLPKVRVEVRSVANSQLPVANSESGIHNSESVRIAVSDNGMGIPDAIRTKIFQPFFTTKPTGEGTGLGLSLSYDIVTKGHGGSLEVESEEGKGSVFTVVLP